MTMGSSKVGDIELKELALLVTNAKPNSITKVRDILDQYFDKIDFSILQSEWKNLPNASKDRLAKKMYEQFKQYQHKQSTLS